MLHSLGEHFKEGGWGMWPITLWGVFVIAITVERSMYLFKSSINKDAFLANIQKCILAGDVGRAIKLCSTAQAPLARIVKAGLMKVNRGEDAVAAAIDEKVEELLPHAKKRVSELFILANIATLFGLLGTILGLIHTFEALDRVSDPGQRQQALARGISEAMNNTALGLGIAVTCFVGYLLLNMRLKHIEEDVQLSAMKLTNILTLGRQQ